MLEKISISLIMKKAQELKIVIPAFNISYLPLVKPVAEVLKEMETFGLIEVSRPDVEKFEAKSFAAVYNEYYKYADLKYMRLHQDHIPVIDEDGKIVDWKNLIQEAIDLGYDSVMIDGSRLSFEENVKVTKEVVKMAHRRNIPVEAELGAVLGHEKGPLPPYEEIFNTGKGFTDIEQAKKFVSLTGVDWLSIAVGNIHGAISGIAKNQKKVEAKLNIEHIRRIAECTGIPLVLHGGSGIKQEYVLEAIKNGICKINIGTEIRQVYEKSLKETHDIESSRESVADKIRYLIEKYYHISGSANRLAVS